MVDSGILKEDDRVELIRGEIIEIFAIGTKHAACVNRLVNLLIHLLGNRIILAPQNPIVLSDNSEPQPDFNCSNPVKIFMRTHILKQAIFFSL